MNSLSRRGPTMADDDERPYKVGFGNPPAATRFKPGQSGNPKGRPRGSKNFDTALVDELNARLTVTENGKRRKITKRQAIAKQVVNKAASGDPKATVIVVNEVRRIEAPSNGDVSASQTLSPEDQLTLEGITNRFRLLIAEEPTDANSPAPYDETPSDPSPETDIEESK